MAKPIDVLLVYPRPTKDSPAKLTPLSILFPGAWLKAQGLRVEYFDQRFDSDDELEELIKTSKEVAVSAMTGRQCAEAASILRLAKKINPDVITAVGGPHARLLSAQVMKEPFVDKVYDLPSYGEDLFPYDLQTRKHFARTDLMYMTSTGCPYRCRFCAQSSPWRPRSIETIKRELGTIHQDIGFETVAFCDQNIAHNSYIDGDKKNLVDHVARVRDIGGILKQMGASWSGSMRCPDLTPVMVDALASSNCRNLHIGCESGSERVLRKVIRKGHGVEAIKQAVLSARGSGIAILYSFITFMPGETLEDIFATMDLIDWIANTDPQALVSIYHYTPYPGTPMYEDAIAGKHGYPAFSPPLTMTEWGNMSLMASPLYWIAGLCFRMDNTRKNFPGEDWQLIDPYVKLARTKWLQRDIKEFPCDEVSLLIEKQVRKWDAERAQKRGLPPETTSQPAA